MYKILMIIIALTLLPGCEVLQLLKPGSGISVDAQVGDREAELSNQKEEVNTGDVEGDVTVNSIKEEGAIKGQDIASIVVNNGLSMWEIGGLITLVVLIALIVPSPLSLWRRKKG